MRLKTRITSAAEEVKSTAEKIGTSVQWNTVALVAVSVVSIVALLVATTAIVGRSK